MIMKMINAIVSSQRPHLAIIKGMAFSALFAVIISEAIFFIIGIGGFLIGGDSGPPSAHYRLHFAQYGLPVALFLGFQIILAIKVKSNKRTYLLGTFSILCAAVFIGIAYTKIFGYPNVSYIYGYLINQPFDQKPLLLPISLARQEIKIDKFGVYEVGFCGKRRAERRNYSIESDIKVQAIADGKPLFSFNNDYSAALDIYDIEDKTVWAFKYLHVPISAKNLPVTLVANVNGALKDPDLMICIKPTRGYVQ